MNRAAIIALAALCLSGPAFGEKAETASDSECFLRSSFTPSDDATSLSLDLMQAQARGQRSMQSRVFAALDDVLRQGSISSGIIALQVSGSCSAALPTVRERVSVLASEQADTVGGGQLNEANANWVEVSALEFERAANRTPVPAPR